MTPSEQRLAIVEHLPFHPILCVELILAIARQIMQKPDRPLLQGMTPEEITFFQQTLQFACQNAGAARSESQVTNYDKR